MSKQLIVDFIPFNIEVDQINESLKENNGRLVVKGVLQRADAKNQNGRVYPKNILIREVKKYLKTQVAENRALGELDHPESSVVNLQNVSHNVQEVWWDGDNVMGKIEVLGTPAGNILKELFKAGIKLGISSRGLGSVKESTENGTVIVQDDFDLVCWDFVSNPSTHGAFMSPLHEVTGNNKKEQPYDKIDKIITDILAEL